MVTKEFFHPMIRYAQVVDGKIHLIHVGSHPDFAPYICMIDISVLNPKPEIGWLYDSATNTFSPPQDASAPSSVIAPTTQKDLFSEPTLRRDVGKPCFDEMGCYGNVWIRRHWYLHAGDTHQGHKHYHNHVSLLTQGKVKLLVEGVETIFTAPTHIIIDKDKEHKITALEDNTVWWCVYALRDDAGNVTDFYNGNNSPYASNE